MSKEFPIPNFRQAADAFTKLRTSELPRLIGNQSKNFFRHSFDNQGFTDSGLRAWPRTKTKENKFGKPSVGILIGTSKLKNSLVVAQANGGIIEITAGNQFVPYAKIHNEGGFVKAVVPVTPKMRKFFWAMWYKTGQEKFKGMALTKKQSFTITFTMKKRQYMGHSKMLYSDIEKTILKKLKEWERNYIINKKI